MRPVIIIMAKQPIKGQTKTRLVPPLTFDEAANLYQALLLDTIDLVISIATVDMAVGVTPPAAQPFFQQITPPRTILLPVEGSDIGACLHAVTADLFERGYKKVLAINSDGPSLPADYLTRAIELLDHHEVVFGPNEDGGYYLVGLVQPEPHLFHEVLWSTDQVFKQSLRKSAKLGLKTGILPSWYDIDTAGDMRHLLADLKKAGPQQLPHSRVFFSQLSPTRLREMESQH